MCFIDMSAIDNLVPYRYSYKYHVEACDMPLAIHRNRTNYLHAFYKRNYVTCHLELVGTCNENRH